MFIRIDFVTIFDYFTRFLIVEYRGKCDIFPCVNIRITLIGRVSTAFCIPISSRVKMDKNLMTHLNEKPVNDNKNKL